MPDSIVLTDATIKEFQEFVEWLLEMHLSGAREAELHQKMSAWDEDDQRPKELVGEYLSAFREIQKSDLGLQESWRKENQPILLGLLREEMPHNQVASLLIEEYESAHRISEAPSPSSSSEVLVAAGLGLLGLFGAALLSNVIKKYREQPSAPNQGTVRGNVLDEMGEIQKSQQKEEEELEKISPELAAQQRMQNQQLRVQMLSNINKMLVETESTIIKNIR